MFISSSSEHVAQCENVFPKLLRMWSTVGLQMIGATAINVQ